MKSRTCVLPLLLFVLAAGPVRADLDQMVLGSASGAPGSSVALPLKIIDADDADLGWSAGAGKKIQGFSLQLLCSPAASVKSVSIARSGLLASMYPLYQKDYASGASAAYLAAYDENYQPIRLINRPEGAEVAQVLVSLASNAAIGTEVHCDFVPANSILSNQSGTASKSQNAQTLKLTGGTITLGNSSGKAFLSITAPGATAYEKPKTPGSFRITRIGKLKGKLIVPLAVSGTATAGKDYAALPALVSFKSGQAAVTLTVTPIRDAIREKKGESVTVVLLPGSGYALSRMKSAKVVIKDAP